MKRPAWSRVLRCCDFSPIADGSHRCKQEINGRMDFSRTPTAAGRRDVWKKEVLSHMNILQRKTLLDGSLMTQVEFYIPLFAPPPSSHGSDFVP